MVQMTTIYLVLDYTDMKCWYNELTIHFSNAIE